MLDAINAMAYSAPRLISLCLVLARDLRRLVHKVSVVQTNVLYNSKIYKALSDRSDHLDKDSIIVAATVAWKNDGGLKHPRKDDFVDFVKGNALIDSGNAKYSASVVIGVNKHGEYTLYDITSITKEDFSYKKADVPQTLCGINHASPYWGNRPISLYEQRYSEGSS